MSTSLVISSLTELLKEHDNQIVDILSKRFDFDKEEALAALSAENHLLLDQDKPKPKKKSGSKTKTTTGANENTTVKKSKKATKPKKPRAKSAYMLFSIHERPVIKEANPGMKMCDISKELGAKWKSLTDEEKAPWVEKHEEEKQKLLEAELQKTQANQHVIKDLEVEGITESDNESDNESSKSELSEEVPLSDNKSDE